MRRAASSYVPDSMYSTVSSSPWKRRSTAGAVRPARGVAPAAFGMADSAAAPAAPFISDRRETFPCCWLRLLVIRSLLGLISRRPCILPGSPQRLVTSRTSFGVGRCRPGRALRSECQRGQRIQVACLDQALDADPLVGAVREGQQPGPERGDHGNAGDSLERPGVGSAGKRAKWQRLAEHLPRGVLACL